MKFSRLLNISKTFILISVMTILNANAADYPLAPAWQLNTQAGDNISLNDYQGKPVILHFWATWCPHTKRIK